MRRRLGEVLRAAVVPIPVRGSVVRVDVAETIVGTVVQMAATADGANHVRVHEVGIITRIGSRTAARRIDRHAGPRIIRIDVLLDDISIGVAARRRGNVQLGKTMRGIVQIVKIGIRRGVGHPKTRVVHEIPVQMIDLVSLADADVEQIHAGHVLVAP